MARSYKLLPPHMDLFLRGGFFLNQAEQVTVQLLPAQTNVPAQPRTMPLLLRLCQLLDISKPSAGHESKPHHSLALCEPDTHDWTSGNPLQPYPVIPA